MTPWNVDPAVWSGWPREPDPPPMDESDSESECPRCHASGFDDGPDLDAPGWEGGAFSREWTCPSCHGTGFAVYHLVEWRDEDTPLPGTYVRALPSDFEEVQTSGDGEVWAWLSKGEDVSAVFRFSHHV